MLNVSKYGFTSKFCIEVYFDDSATMTGKYFTHIEEIVTELDHVLLSSWRFSLFKKIIPTKLCLEIKFELCKGNVLYLRLFYLY